MKSEYRAMVSDEPNFLWQKQVWQNNNGVRSVGGETEDGRIIDSSIRFDKDEKYGWDEKSIKKWLKKKGYDMISLKSVKPKDFEVWEGREAKIDFKILSDLNIVNKEKYKEGEDLIVEGIVNSDSVDAHEEIVDPEAVMESKDFFMKFPTFRLMHQADPIGKVLDIWQKGNQVLSRMRIDGEEIKTIKKVLKGTLAAFSIGFRVLKVEQFCPDKDEKGNLKCYWKFTKIMLVEISLVDSPANRDAVMTRNYYKSLIAPKWVEDQQVTGYKTTSIIDPSEVDEIEIDDEDDECEVCNSIVLEKAEDRECECIECGNTIKTTKHCKDLKCAKCGGQMRNKARPGPGQKTKIDSPIKKKKLKTKNGSGVNIHKIIINKPFSDLDTNKLDKIIRGFEMSEESEDQEITQDGATDEIPEVVAPVSEEQPENPEVEVSTEDKILAVMQKMTDKQDTFEKEIQKMKMSAEERVAQEALDKAVEEKLIAKNAEMEEMKVKFAELEKKQAIQDEVQKQLGKLSPIKQSLSADAPDENGDDKYNNLMPGIDKSKQQAYKDTAKILQSYASPIDED